MKRANVAASFIYISLLLIIALHSVWIKKYIKLWNELKDGKYICRIVIVEISFSIGFVIFVTTFMLIMYYFGYAWILQVSLIVLVFCLMISQIFLWIKSIIIYSSSNNKFLDSMMNLINKNSSKIVQEWMKNENCDSAENCKVIAKNFISKASRNGIILNSIPFSLFIIGILQIIIILLLMCLIKPACSEEDKNLNKKHNNL